MSNHEHRQSYGPIGETVKAIDQAGDNIVTGLTHLVTRHDHDGGEQPHHHSADELTGMVQSDPTPEPNPSPPQSRPMILWEKLDDDER
jgi:hypothetical protein